MEVKKNIQNMLVACNAVNPGEKILIVADNLPRPAHLGQTLLDAMLEMGLDTTLAVIPPRKVDGAEPTAAVAAAMKAVNAIFSVAEGATIAHTTARKESSALGVRFHLITALEDDLAKHELKKEDLELVKERTKKIAKVLKEGRRARVTGPAGTDISFQIGGRAVLAVYPSNPNNGTIPYYAESATTPIEGTAEGTIVVDLAFRNWNYLLTEPLSITVKGGKAVEMKGAQKDYDLLWKIATTDENASNIAELGIGTCHFLPREMRGTSLDFARYGTAHFALGRNNDIGGQTMSRIHQDVLINKPTIMIDDQCIMKEGELLI
ncbi:MAG: aminopeptidase [Thermodesulfobacteriota bacterium]